MVRIAALPRGRMSTASSEHGSSSVVGASYRVSACGSEDTVEFDGSYGVRGLEV